MQKKMSTKFMVQGAMIAAIYVVLTMIFKPISFGAMQCRECLWVVFWEIFWAAAPL